MIDTEKLFQQLAAKDWDNLSEMLLQNKGLIHKDPYLDRVAQLFETEFFDHIAPMSATERVIKMRHISLIIDSDRKCFAGAFVDKLIDQKLHALKEAGDKTLANYASTYFERPLAKQILLELRREDPEQLAQARHSFAKIDAATSRNSSAKTVKLFKSPQEEIFFNALRDAFPLFIPYPNVAMSCAIDIDAIRDSLSPEEREYFFKAIIDFVLYDPKTGHEPIHFFELDSKYHDGEKARRNDALKNSIFSAAGIKLVRIRAFVANETTASDFKKLVLDLVTEN